MLIDAHAHLQDEVYTADFPSMIERARQNNVRAIITVGTDIPDSQKCILLTREYPDIFATVGMHPNEASKWSGDAESILKNLAKNLKVVAIGETGLDHHYAPGPGVKKDQETIFRSQIAMARELGLPLMIHVRDAHEDALRILKEEKAMAMGGVVHCFTGEWGTAEKYLALGFSISFGGIVTFGKRSAALEEVARRIPEDRIILETDCPWLAPEPYRGKRNEPAFVPLVADRMAQLRGVGRQELEDLTTGNATRIFRLELNPQSLKIQNPLS